jgi:hypothetical protein
MISLEKQVVNLELSKRLKELGVKQESYFKWVGAQLWDETQQSDYESKSTPPRSTCIAAFTVAELGELLPPYWMLLKNIDYFRLLWWKASPEDEYQETLMLRKSDYELTADTPADCMAKMLIYLVENKFVILS